MMLYGDHDNKLQPMSPSEGEQQTSYGITEPQYNFLSVFFFFFENSTQFLGNYELNVLGYAPPIKT